MSLGKDSDVSGVVLLDCNAMWLGEWIPTFRDWSSGM